MKTIFVLVFQLLSVLVSRTYGHGYVSILEVDGTSYKGQEPTEDGQPDVPSVIRRISTINPVKGSNNPSLNCGQNATSASLVAPTKPGSSLVFQWEAGGGQGVGSEVYFARHLIQY
jgi:hypothetical protein